MSFLSELVGNPKKAILTIHKAPAEGGLLGDIAEAAAGALEAVNDVLDAVGVDGIAGAHSMRVQYNPSTLTITANADTTSYLFLQQNVEQGVPNQATRPPSVVMSVELIFDEVSVRDAFMGEKMQLSAGGLATLPGTISKALAGGFTVQPQTNALLFMLLQESSRKVTFDWGKMSFSGEVSEVNARYTMFSVSGKPIRSVVKFNITQNVDGKAESKRWNKAYEAVFKEGGGVAAKLLDKANNLINLNL